ncbi:MAG: protein translocase subunit SecD [Parcubacteria group bacterium]|jgi:protein-export membrane protein SecD
MFRKNLRKFIYVIIFSIVMIVIALPTVKYLPESVQGRFEKLAVNLGLDLQGGLHLEYKLDLSNVPDEKKGEAKNAVQAAAERKVNAYGVGEPIVWLSERGAETYLMVEIPGVKNIEDVKNVIQKAPLLEFKESKTEEEMAKEKTDMDAAMAETLAPMNEEAHQKAIGALERAKNGEDFVALGKEFSQNPDTATGEENVIDFKKRADLPTELGDALFSDNLSDGSVYPNLIETDQGWFIIKKLEMRGEGDEREVRAQYIPFGKVSIPVEPYKTTGLTGEFLERADVNMQNTMGGGISEPAVLLTFNGEGKDLFAEITKRNLGKPVAIYLDNQLISAPTVQAEIVDGRAEITGNFTVTEAKELARQLTEGSLPVPFELVSQQSVEATLGAEALAKSLKAGMYGLLLTMIFMTLYYRLFGLIAALALCVYTGTLVTIFKLSSYTPLSITLTLAGIAGITLSIGMAVDANVLIFERIREELRFGKPLRRAIAEGFKRAWPSIRDGNVSTIITSVILMMMGTSFVKGFALILILGIVVHIFTAIVLVRIVLTYISGDWLSNHSWLIMSNKKK